MKNGLKTLSKVKPAKRAKAQEQQIMERLIATPARGEAIYEYLKIFNLRLGSLEGYLKRVESQNCAIIKVLNQMRGDHGKAISRLRDRQVEARAEVRKLRQTNKELTTALYETPVA